MQSSKKLEVDAVWKAGFDDLSEGRNLKPVGQSNKVVLYTASVAGAVTFSKVGLNGEGRGWTAEISKKGKNHKKHMRTTFLLRVGGSGKVKGHATTQLVSSYGCRAQICAPIRL